MKRFSMYVAGVLLLATLSPYALFSTDTIRVDQAFRKGLIRVSVKGNGGYHGPCIRLAVQNKTPKSLVLAIPPGLLFPSKDTSVQDLMTTAPLAFGVGPRSTKSVDVMTMCTQSYNMGPDKGDAFSLGKPVEGHLLELAELIAEYDYQTSTAQSAVWAVANGDPVSSVYGTDTAMVRRVANVVSDATGTPISEFHIQPRRHRITSINTSLECYMKRDLPSSRLALFDGEGNELRTYFDDQYFEEGFMQFRVGINHTRGDSADLFLRLMQGDSVISERQVFVGDSIPPMRRLNSQTSINYKLDRDVRAKIGVYDDQDRLMLILGRNKFIRRGYHRSTFVVGKELPLDAELFVKIKANGETLASKRIDVNSQPTARFPRRFVKGTFRMKLEDQLEDARLAVYNEEGEMIRIFFEHSKLYPGRKALDYSFRHFHGPDAVLYLRLTDGEDKLIKEERLEP